MAFRDEITPEQELLIPSYRSTWQQLALSTARIEHEKVIEAIQAVYELIQLPKPEIIFFESPYVAAKAAEPLYKNPYFKKSGLVYATKIMVQLHKKFYAENEEAIGHWDGWVESQLTLNESCEIDTNLSASLKNSFTEGFSKKFQTCQRHVFWLFPLSRYIHLGAFFDFHFSVAKNTLFRPHDELAWEVFKKLVQSCGWIIPFQDTCYVSERPTKFLYDSKSRLHAEGKAAVKFSDGSKLYSYHGVTLPDEYGEIDLKQWQPQCLLEESDEILKQILVKAITAKSNTDKNRYFTETLELAAKLGRLKLVEYILKNEKEFCPSLSNALAFGAESENINILQMLIDAEATINCCTEYGTPLIAAARTGNVDIVRYLVESGANPNMWIDDSGYMSPLFAAVFEGNQEVCDYLLPLITDPEEIEYAKQELPKAVIRKKRRENKQLQQFFGAVMENNTLLVRELITQGFDINEFDEDGQAALHCAVSFGHVKMIKLLAELGANLNISNEDGKTPLMCAVGIRAFQAWAMRALISVGADLNCKDENGYTALSYTAIDSSIPSVFEEILLKADAKYGDWKGTEIYDAAKYGNVRLINRLVAEGIDINQTDPEDGLTPLMKAVLNSKPWVMRALIRAGANVNMKTTDGKTALDFCEFAILRHPVIKKILLKSGANQDEFYSF